MQTKFILTILLFTLAQLAYPQSALERKKSWTVSEVKVWAEKNRSNATWHSLLLYQGSDTSTHHFISRIMDEWIWFAIKRADLILTDERPYKKTSSVRLGYYYVDPAEDFAKIKDY
ncbi:hypothetical protein [Foetidibacter luteolus]|uniref:hypothetical protein n=1 Tax=Foetidibacter luteolus TaxID=2608880 RepID=UPI00129A6F9E|nr:hypothetical protein [Foetidibacter luteolus]